MIFVIIVCFVLLFLGLGSSFSNITDNQKEILKQNQQIIELLQNRK